MNKNFIKHALMYGEIGKAWLKQIPQIINEYEHKWSIKVLSPYTLTYNYVAPVTGNNGSQAVIKIGLPQDKEFQSEIEALKIFNGDGITKLLKADKEKAVILIEQVVPGTPLSTIENDEKATKIIASVMKKLWKPLPVNHHFITISQWTRALYGYHLQYNHNLPIPLDLVEKAKRLFYELIKTSETPVLIHADLHHDNILSSSRNDWLVIDPKGIVAEPAYETSAMIRNPYKKISKMKNVEKLLKTRIKILSEELNINPERIRKWCLAQTILSGVWTSENQDDTKHALKVIRALEKFSF